MLHIGAIGLDLINVAMVIPALNCLMLAWIIHSMRKHRG